jgi:hypothetical protein
MANSLAARLLKNSLTGAHHVQIGAGDLSRAGRSRQRGTSPPEADKPARGGQVGKVASHIMWQEQGVGERDTRQNVRAPVGSSVRAKQRNTRMDAPGKYMVSTRIIVFEAIAFIFIIVLIWLDQVIDIPHLLLGAEATPINWREALFESIIVGIVGAIIINYTNKLFQRMKHLEGILPICASCKRIRDEKGDWHQMEAYIDARSEATFSHSICPECGEKLYPEFKSYKREG